MKFNLNITDMSAEEFADLFNKLNVPAVEVHPAFIPENEPDMPKTDIAEVDNDGLHWDARIHSSNHQMTAKGVWQRRRGISDEEFNRVKNELLGVQEPVAEIVPPVTIAQTPMGEYSTVAPVAPVVAPAPVAPTAYAPAPVAPVAPEPTPVIDSAVLYRTMFDKIREGLVIQKVCRNDIQELLNAVNAQFGLQYTELVQVKDNIPAMQFVINDLTARGL